uniref:ATP synthase F0 subunit 8 n=1 Tax=Tetraselmis marina TaxID=41888 RepID=UPI0021821AC8|nr:ATP synthase F0 subunit 8 [Tetraselmis marina]UVF37897.1 ATP synthase F0 subunit 8 [Tetraselmis marina]
MPQLDTVTYMSQFFWLCFFFVGFYFVLVQFFLPKMARILKFRQEKMAKIQGQSSLYLNERSVQQEKRFAHYTACLDIQKKLADTSGIRTKNISEEAWENEAALKSQQTLHEAFLYDNVMFHDHMLGQNSSIVYLLLMKKNSPLLSGTLVNRYFLQK